MSSISRDLEKIRGLVAPFKARLPAFARGMVDRLVTREAIREMYLAVGGAAGVREVAEAIIRIAEDADDHDQAEGSGQPEP